MRLLNTLNGYECDAEITERVQDVAEPQRVLVDVATGAVIDRLAFRAAGQVLEATDAERKALRLGGFLDVSA